MRDHTIDPRAGHLELVATEVAALACDVVRNEVGHARTARTKSTPTDVVTHTDIAAETLIRAELLQRCPGSSILGEEFDVAEGANNVGWVVDPIDGTVNFLYDLPVVSVSIAATLAGAPIAGAVIDIHRGDVFTARRHGGARMNGEPIATSQANDLSQSLVGTGFAYDARLRAEQADTLNAVLPAVRDIRCMGSAALNLCWVAAGRLDAYFERDLKPYDYAAGALIADEAGATVEMPSEDNGSLSLAAAPGIHRSLRSLLL